MPRHVSCAPAISARFSQLVCSVLLTGLSLVAMGGTARADGAPLRVCMDPDNAPFSSSKPGVGGFYYELGQHVAQVIGRPFEPVWTLSYFGKRSVRTTLLDKQCDAYMGLPQTKDFMGPNVTFSHPVAQLGFVLVLPQGRVVQSVADLKGLRVAVQFASPPQSLIATHDEITTVTVIETADAMTALADHKADAAFIWGPTAGYINKTIMHDAYQIIPVAGDDMQWKAAIGFARDQGVQRDQVNAALDTSAATIAALQVKYGFPAANAPAITLASAEGAFDPRNVRLAASSEPAVQASAEDGHELFNATCSHCHGPDAIQADRHIDLRRLHIRYRDTMDEVFDTTVHNGRPDKGMPNWSGIISDEDLGKIKAWLHTVQTP